MRRSKLSQGFVREKETVDGCLDRVMDTIRRELEKGSPEDYKKLIVKRRRRTRKGKA